jgi:hypothetical protein
MWQKPHCEWVKSHIASAVPAQIVLTIDRSFDREYPFLTPDDSSVTQHVEPLTLTRIL